MGDTPSKENEARLRVLARERVRDGTLPRTRAARTWGGFGNGAACSLCKTPIVVSEPELELQFDNPAVSDAMVRFHHICHVMWELACQELAAQRWPDVPLPPASRLTDAQLELGESERSS